MRWLAAGLLILALHIGCTALALIALAGARGCRHAAGAMLVDMVPAPAVPIDSPMLRTGPLVEEAMLAPPPTLERKDVPLPEEQPKLEPSPLAPRAGGCAAD
jgi:hypothetical protein